MKLKSVQVKNFKCVEDSTEFEICPVTCLVGKNEAGKTSLLEALYKLNPDVDELGEFDMLLEYPRRRRKEYERREDTEPDDALITKWELEDEDVRLLEQSFGPGVVRSRTVMIRKGYYKGRKWTINCAESPSDETSAPIPLQTKLEGLLPKFVYFSKFNIMNGRISIGQILESQRQGKLSGPERVFLALLDLVGTNPRKVKNIESSEELIADLEAASAPITDKIFRYWSQNSNLRVCFQVHPGKPQDLPPFDKGLVFETRILNPRHNLTLNFDERSTGFVWFFSFLVWFSQTRKNYGENLVILLDDPGLGLHARAQEDLLRYISEELEPRYQVVYTTHSPFMVEPAKLARARTVEDIIVKSDGGLEEYLGTKVGDRVLSTNTDTLVPLQAALGYEMTRNLFGNKKVLLVERLSDLLYLNWFSRRLSHQGRPALNSDWSIVPCGGLEKLGALIGLLGADRPDLTVMLDGAISHRFNALHPKISELLRNCHVFSPGMYLGASDRTIEDLIGRKAYFSLVNLCYRLSRKHRLRSAGEPSADICVVKEVEEYFKALSPAIPHYDRYAPAEYLAENTKKLTHKLPDLDEALGRFEMLFTDLNSGSAPQ